MAIPINLLDFTDNQALGIVVYGGAGLRKSLAKHTLPGPVLDFDLEGGNVALMPWMRRKRKYNEKVWQEVTQEQRQKIHSLIPRDKQATGIAPQPIIDSVWYDNTAKDAYTQFSIDIANFDLDKYNSICIDSMNEFSASIQTFSKKDGQELNPVRTEEWPGIQERTAMQLRKLRNYRNSGVFIYLIGQETINHAYVRNPRTKQPGEPPQEPYATNGSISVPGKMIEAIQGVTDLMARARQVGPHPQFIFKKEPISGSIQWQAKDRTGRVSPQSPTNFREIFKEIYGQSGYEGIYTSASELLARGVF